MGNIKGKLSDNLECNVVLGERQEEYQSLHAHIDNAGVLTYGFELSDTELNDILNNKRIFIKQYTFNQPMQPMQVLSSLLDNNPIINHTVNIVPAMVSVYTRLYSSTKQRINDFYTYISVLCKDTDVSHVICSPKVSTIFTRADSNDLFTFEYDAFAVSDFVIIGDTKYEVDGIVKWISHIGTNNESN